MENINDKLKVGEIFINKFSFIIFFSAILIAFLIYFSTYKLLKEGFIKISEEKAYNLQNNITNKLYRSLLDINKISSNPLCSLKQGDKHQYLSCNFQLKDNDFKYIVKTDYQLLSLKDLQGMAASNRCFIKKNNQKQNIYCTVALKNNSQDNSQKFLVVNIDNNILYQEEVSDNNILTILINDHEMFQILDNANFSINYKSLSNYIKNLNLDSSKTTIFEYNDLLITLVPYKKENVLYGNIATISMVPMIDIKLKTIKLSAVIIISTWLILLIFFIITKIFLKVKIFGPMNDLVKSTNEFLTGEIMEIQAIDPQNALGTVSDLLKNIIKNLVTSKNDLVTANLKLINSENKTRSILNNIIDAVITFNEYGIIKSFSPSAQKIFGYDEKQIINSSMITLFHEDSYHIFDEAVMSSYVRNNQKINEGLKVEFVALRSDQKSFPADLSLSKILQKRNNDQFLCVAIIRDITSNKKQELELFLAKERAEKAKAAKDDFLSNMSHEIRTPLNGIVAMIDLLLTTEASEEQLGYLNIMKSSSESFLLLLSNIIDFTSIESEEKQVQLHPVSIIDITKEIEFSCKMKAIDKALEFEINITQNTPKSIISNYKWLKSIFYHLTSNAIKFTSVGSVKIFVDAKQEDNKNLLIIKVIDTGIGIEKEDIEKIFIAFNQVDNSDNRQYGGTGLGLTIVNKLVEMFDGKIIIDSIVKVGSTFTVIIPYKPLE